MDQHQMQEVINEMQITLNDVRDNTTITARRVDCIESSISMPSDVMHRIEDLVNQKVEERLEFFARIILESICEKFGDVITVETLANFLRNYQEKEACA